MLISPFSFADWGDVYYCQMTSHSRVSFEGKRTDYILEKFQFKLDKTKNGMVFGGSGYYKNTVYKLTPDSYWPDIWRTHDDYSRSYFKDGKFIEATVRPFAGIISISANCDKF